MRDLFSHELALPPPPPPPGMGEAVAFGGITRAAYRRGQLRLLVVVYVFLLIVGRIGFWPWDLADRLILLIGGGLYWLLALVIQRPLAISVGEDWLRLYPPPSERGKPFWVRTDRLTTVEQVFEGWLRPALRLTDEERRTVTVELGDLKADPEVFEVFCRAARRAYQEGRLKGIKPGLVRQLGLDGA